MRREYSRFYVVNLSMWCFMDFLFVRKIHIYVFKWNNFFRQGKFSKHWENVCFTQTRKTLRFKLLCRPKFNENAFSIRIDSVRMSWMELLLDLSITPKTLVRSDLLQRSEYFDFVINIMVYNPENCLEFTAITRCYGTWDVISQMFLHWLYLVQLLFKGCAYAI